MAIFASNPLVKAWETMAGRGKKQQVLDEAAAQSYSQAADPFQSLPSGKDIFGENPLINQSFYKPVQVENPYEQELKKSLQQNMSPDFGQAQATAGNQGQFAQALQGLYGTGAAGLTGLIGQLQKQQTGDFGPGGSLAQKILEQGLGQNIAGVRSQLASQRGLSPALAARYAAEQTAQLGGQTAQQAGILGLQQQLGAQQMLGQLTTGAAQLGSKAGDIYGQMRGQDIAQATATSDAALKRLSILAQSDTGMRELQAKTGMNENEIKAKIAAADQAAKMGDRKMAAEILGSITGAFAQAGAKAAFAYSGGRIGGKAPIPGDHPKNDVVDAKLSPGEIVIPRSAAGSREAAKSFIDSLDDFDDEPSYGKVLKARQKKNYADGGVVDPDLDQEILDKYRSQQVQKSYEAPVPGVERFKQGLNTMLTENVVEPLARRGYENLGAGIATVPSTLAEALLPSSMAEMQAVIPLPGAKLGRKAAEEIKKGKAADLLEQMSADDADISKLPSLSEFKKLGKEYKKQKLKQVNEESFLRSQGTKQEASKAAKEAWNDIFANPDKVGFPTDVLEELAQNNLDNKNIAKAFDEYQQMTKAVPWATRVKQATQGIAINNLEFQKRVNAYEISRKKLYEALKDNKADLKFSDEMEALKKVRKFPKGEGPLTPYETKVQRETESKKFWDKNKKDED